MSVQFDNIPQELKDRDQWVVWAYEYRRGQATKVPYDPVALTRASSTDLTTWSDYNTARAALDYDPTLTTKFAGLGYVFSAEDPYVGVDLDDCYHASQLDPGEAEWVRALNSYTEVSPSGTGVKVIVRGKLPKDLERHSWGGNGIYDQARFFTITGNTLQGREHLNDVDPVALQQLLATWFPPLVQHEWAEEEERLTDTEVTHIAQCAANREKFLDLYVFGRWPGWYPSQSDADMGLVNMLAFYTGPAPQQLDRLFRQSGLMRPKWDERRGTSTYGEQTISRALERQEEFYDMGVRASGIIGPNPGEGALSSKIEFTLPGIITPVVSEHPRKKWRDTLDNYPSLTNDERPLYLRLVHEHVAPLAQRLGPDWVDLMALSFLSSFFAGVTIERKPLNVWVLGISAQGVGKSVTSDELELITRETASFLANNLSTFTGGSTAGLIRLMQGTRRKVLCYSSEWTALVKLMESEHSGSLREMLLNTYDGRSYTHSLASETIQIDYPYFVANGLTTKGSWQKEVDSLDTGNGFYSRFLFVCPDVGAASEEYPYRTHAQRQTVVGELYGHLSNLPSGIEMATLETRVSPALRAYGQFLGIGEQHGPIDMDEVGLSVDDRDTQPIGRRLDQVKKVATLLELLEEQPQLRGGMYRVREKNVELAVRLVQRGNAYARRAYGWLARSSDEHNAQVVRRALELQPSSEYGLIGSTGLGTIPVRNALELLGNEGLVTSEIVGGRRVYKTA